MASIRRGLLSIVGLLASASVAWTQSTSMVTQDDHFSRGGIAIGITVQGPADVNQPQLCQRLYVPCLSPKSAPDFGVVMSAVGYLTKSLGVIGETSVYANRWESFGTKCFPADGRVQQECPVQDTNHVRSIVAGLRGRTSVWEDPFGEHYRVFVQGLVGPQWSSIGSTQLGDPARHRG